MKYPILVMVGRAKNIASYVCWWQDESIIAVGLLKKENRSMTLQLTREHFRIDSRWFCAGSADIVGGSPTTAIPSQKKLES